MNVHSCLLQNLPSLKIAYHSSGQMLMTFCSNRIVKKHWEGVKLDEDEVKDLKRVLPKKTNPERESKVSKLQVAVTFSASDLKGPPHSFQNLRGAGLSTDCV